MPSLRDDQYMQPGAQPMSQDDLLMRFYIGIAALAGAFSSLGARSWRGMTRTKMLVTVATGTLFAVFVTPYAAHSFIGIQEGDARATVALTYLFAFAAHILLPRFVHWLEKMIGTGDSQ
jgi:uncharacterized membrane protein YozB (DUF420 family)